MKKRIIFATAFGGMAEWSNAAVLKTVEGHTSGGSNPSSSAELKPVTLRYGFFVLLKHTHTFILRKVCNYCIPYLSLFSYLQSLTNDYKRLQAINYTCKKTTW